MNIIEYEMLPSVVYCLNHSKIPGAELARHLGISVKHVYKIKHGEVKNPRGKIINDINNWYARHPEFIGE